MNLFLQLTASTSHFPVTAVSVLIVGFILAVTIGSISWFNSDKVVGWKENTGVNNQNTNTNSQKSANYDRNIISAETSARMKREGSNFKQTPETDGMTTGGYTVSREGLLNNYAVEPEMYINQPGDLKSKQEQEKAERVKELQEVNSEGGKGTGII